MVDNLPDLIEVIRGEGYELRQRGKYYWGLCAFHPEKIPSFVGDPVRQRFYCFGCHTHGNVLTFIQKLKNLSFKETLRYLGINGKPYQPDPKEIKKRQLVKVFRQWCNDYFNDLADLYRCLQKAKERIKTEEDLERLVEFYHKESVWLYEIEILQDDDDRKLKLYESYIDGAY